MVVVGAGVGGLATAARIISSQLTNTNNDNVEVTIIEKNSRDFVGGRCGSFDVTVNDVGTFRHERGPSLLLLKDEYEQLFADCSSSNVVGSSSADKKTKKTQQQTNNSANSAAAQAFGLQMKQCVPAYQVVFDDGDTISLGFPRSKCDLGLSIEEMKQLQIVEQKSISKFNALEPPNGFQKWSEYLDTCAAYLDCGLPNFIEERLHISSLPSFVYEALREGGKRWPLQPHSTMLSSLFTNPKMIALASFQNLYVGLEPYVNSNQFGGGVARKTAPAVFGLLAAIEVHPTNDRGGVFAPVGGFRQVAESMYDLCRDVGVEFQFDSSVTSITNEGVHYISRNEGGREHTRGFIPADLVICNADLPFATETITRAEVTTEKITSSSNGIDDDDDSLLYQESYDWNDDFDYSSGVIAFHWSISQRCDALNTHNVFMSANSASDAEQSWAVLREGGGGMANNTDSCQPSSSMTGTPFNFYVHRASLTDSTAAPEGCDAVMVLVPCPTLMRDKDLASLSRDEAIEAYKQQFNADVVNDARAAVFQRLSVLDGLENVKDFILDEVVDTPGSYADYYNVGAGVPFGLVSFL